MNNSSDPIHVSLLTTLSDLGTWFCEDAGCEKEGDEHVARYSDRPINFKTATTAPEVSQLPSQTIPVMLLRFVDLLSVKTTMDLFESRAGFYPAVVMVYRNEHESDFKMSCLACGQKLWVRDADTGKKGQCPQCQKSFAIPQQEELITSLLSIPTTNAVYRIVRGKPESLTQPLEHILEEHTRLQKEHDLNEETANNNSTMVLKLDVSND